MPEGVVPFPADAPILGRITGAVGDVHHRCEEARQLGPRGLGPERGVADGQAEETGKAEGLDRRRLCFQVSAEDLGAHVDAEHGLHAGSEPPGGR